MDSIVKLLKKLKKKIHPKNKRKKDLDSNKKPYALFENQGTLVKREGINYAFRFVRNMQKRGGGDYLEFGVYRGRTTVEAFKKAKELNFDTMRFFAFDSFEGLPSLSDEEKDFGQFYEGQYSCSVENFLENLKAANVDLSRVITIPGFYDKSLADPNIKSIHSIKKASVVWIDCDLYESTVPVLDFITDIIDAGTILVFDDYFSFGGDLYTGEIRAIREWLERNPDISLEHYRDYGDFSRMFIVQKKHN